MFEYVWICLDMVGQLWRVVTLPVFSNYQWLHSPPIADPKNWRRSRWMWEWQQSSFKWRGELRWTVAETQMGGCQRGIGRPSLGKSIGWWLAINGTIKNPATRITKKCLCWVSKICHDSYAWIVNSWIWFVGHRGCQSGSLCISNGLLGRKNQVKDKDFN